MSKTQDLKYVLTAWKRGEYQRVVTRGMSVIQSGADASSIIALYADALLQLDRTQEAREAFTLALSILPISRHRRILNALASLELLADCYEASKDYSLRAIAIAPDHASAYIYLGVCYGSTKRFAEAEAQFTRATSCTDGAIDEAWYNLGLAQSIRGASSEAATSFRRALAIDLGYESARMALTALERNHRRAPGV